MLSRLSNTVDGIADQEEFKVEKWNMEKIKRIEKHLDADGDVEVAMAELEKVLGYKWEKFYGQIRHGLESHK
ncbi:MAG: hypothetical protein U0944_00195 [Candidatus Moranbacteria bacterium]|nr:hypothetical protein [Candidatus Moranbacteria bacterium]